MAKNIDFINDNVNNLILKVSLPLILSSIVISTVQLSNVAFMGNLGGDEAYLRALYTPFAFLLIAITEAFQISNQVSIAQLNGAGNKKGMQQHIVFFFFISFICSILIFLIIYLAAPLIRSFYNIQGDLANEFINFIKLMFSLNFLAIFGVIMSSTLRSIGKVNLSTFLNIGYACTNIFLVYIFAFHFNQGLFSLIYGNLISSLLLCISSTVILLKLNVLDFNAMKFKITDFNSYSKSIFFLKVVAIPVFLSYVIIFISNLFYNNIVQSFGKTVLSGFNIGYYIQTFLIIPAIAIGSAIGLIVNNIIGAKDNYARISHVIRRGVYLTFILYAVVTSIIFILKNNIANLMLIDKLAANHAIMFLSIIVPSLSFFGLVLMIITLLEQLNKGMLAVTLNVLYFIIIITVGKILTKFYGEVSYLYWTMSIMNVLGFITSLIVLKMVSKQFNKSPEKEMKEDDLMFKKYDSQYVDDILSLFTEKDFYFKNFTPHYLGKDEILNLIEEDTIVILQDEKVFGLVEFECIMDSAHHYKIHFRLSNKLDKKMWTEILNDSIKAFTYKTKVIKLGVHCIEIDKYYLDILENVGFEIEGQLENLIKFNDKSHSLVYLHKLNAINYNEYKEKTVNRFSEERSEFNVNGI